MNGKEYLMTQIAMVQLGKRIQELDIDSFLKCVHNAEKSIETLDKALLKRTTENLSSVKELAEGFQQVKITMDKVHGHILKTTLAYLSKAPATPIPHEWECECDNCLSIARKRKASFDPQGSDG